MRGSILYYKDILNENIIKKIKNFNNNDNFNDIITNEKTYTSICVNLAYGKLDEVNNEKLIDYLIEKIDTYYSDIGCATLHYYLLKNDIKSDDIDEKYLSLINSIENLKIKDMLFLLPIVSRTFVLTGENEKVLSNIFKKIDMLTLFKKEVFLDHFLEEYKMYIGVPIKKKYFKSVEDYNLYKVMKKLTTHLLTDKDIELVKDIDIPIKQFYFLNYHCFIQGNKKLSSSNSIIFNYILYSILDNKDLDVDALITIDKFSEKHPDDFKRIYKYLYLVNNEKTFKFLINNDCFSVYLLENHMEILKNPLSKLLNEKTSNHCINQITKLEDLLIDDLEFLINYIKSNDIMISYNSTFLNNLIKHKKVNVKDINCINEYGKLFIGNGYFEDITYINFCENSLIEFLDLKKHLPLEYFKKITNISITDISNDKELYNKEFLEFYLDIVFFFDPNNYVKNLCEILLDNELTKVLEYKKEEIDFIITYLKTKKLISNDSARQLENLYREKEVVFSMAALEQLIKDNLYTIDWNDTIKEYIDKVPFENEVSIMSIYFLLKKHNLLNYENLNYIENKIYTLSRFS